MNLLVVALSNEWGLKGGIYIKYKCPDLNPFISLKKEIVHDRETTCYLGKGYITRKECYLEKSSWLDVFLNPLYLYKTIASVNNYTFNLFSTHLLLYYLDIMIAKLEARVDLFSNIYD